MCVHHSMYVRHAPVSVFRFLACECCLRQAMFKDARRVVFVGILKHPMALWLHKVRVLSLSLIHI